jgi:APA family basic amino acid/polyamine antiporter
VVFFAYIGFDAVSTAAQEAKVPSRDMPIGILGSLVICTILYVAVGLVLTGIVPFDRLNVPDPIAVGIDAAGVGWLAADQARHRVRPDFGHSGDAACATPHLRRHGL